MTTNANAEYLQAADEVISLAQTILLTPEAIPHSDVEALLDLRAGLLTRATDNVAGVAYRSVASHLGHNLNDHTEIDSVLNPVEPRDNFALIGAVEVSSGCLGTTRKTASSGLKMRWCRVISRSRYSRVLSSSMAPCQ